MKAYIEALKALIKRAERDDPVALAVMELLVGDGSTWKWLDHTPRPATWSTHWHTNGEGW